MSGHVKRFRLYDLNYEYKKINQNLHQ